MRRQHVIATVHDTIERYPFLCSEKAGVYTLTGQGIAHYSELILHRKQQIGEASPCWSFTVELGWICRMVSSGGVNLHGVEPDAWHEEWQAHRFYHRLRRSIEDHWYWQDDELYSRNEVFADSNAQVLAEVHEPTYSKGKFRLFDDNERLDTTTGAQSMVVAHIRPSMTMNAVSSPPTVTAPLISPAMSRTPSVLAAS